MTFLLSQERIISELEELTKLHEFIQERMNKRRIDYLSTVDSIRRFQQDLLDDNDQISNGALKKKKYYHIPTYSIAPNVEQRETTSITDLHLPQLNQTKEIIRNQVVKPKHKHSDEAEVDEILRKPSFRERQMQKVESEILQILDAPTAKENQALLKFKSSEGSRIKEYCPLLTKEDCIKQNTTCDKIHFKRVTMPHTDISMGDCSYLDTCRHMKTCKFIHYEIDQTEKEIALPKPKPFMQLLEPQWIRCDVRTLDMTLLGKFSVIMADPPWDIHMNLPYGTLSDDEMRNLNVKCLQDDGFMFLWVTGRSMELGRECLQIWGYERVEEIVWIKTNQLQRIIRTGRTGHWINHSKEHCLVGIKGNPQVNRFIDCDVVVAEVRETSRKPDEVYGMIERLSPGTRKLELFGRQHNVHAGWVTLGNQLDGVHVLEPFLQEKLKNYDPYSQTPAPSTTQSTSAK